jgi:hypothetical protein
MPLRLAFKIAQIGCPPGFSHPATGRSDNLLKADSHFQL